MRPVISIVAENDDCSVTLRALATSCGFDVCSVTSKTDEERWSLTVPASGIVKICYYDKTFDSFPLPTYLRRIESSLKNAYIQWQQRSLPLTANWVLSRREQRLQHPNHLPISLTSSEVAILTMLLEAQDAPVARDHLRSMIFDQQQGSDSHTLETHLYRLRGKCAQAEGLLLDIQSSSDGIVLQMAPHKQPEQIT
jgi:hypothetical protein